MAGKFEVVGETTETETPVEKQDSGAALRMLMVALGALSKRFIVALADLFTLVTVVSVWWVWMSIPEPNVNQLVALAMYALFVLAVNFIVRR